MAKFTFVHIVLFSIVSSGLTMTVNDLLGLGYLRQARPEEPRVVEVVRWRQSVCLTPAPGVLPCMVGLENSQPSHQAQEQYSHGSSYQGKQHFEEEEKEADDHLLKTLTRDDEALEISGSLESEEDLDLFLKKRQSRGVPVPKLLSPGVVKFVQLENLGPSILGDSIQGPRGSRYLRLGPGLGGNSARKQTVYVTKVVDSPVVATLVASTCLPDIGIPLCDEIQQSQQNSEGSHYQPQQPQQNYQAQYPQQSPGNSQYEAQYSQQNPTGPNYGAQYSQQNQNYGAQYSQQNQNYGAQYPQQNPGGPNHQYPGPQQFPNPSYPAPGPVSNSNGNNVQQQSTPAPNIIQNIADFWNRPQVVQTNETPDVKPVVVYQQPPPAGLFDGINAFLMPNGSWFGIGQLPQLPQIPNLQQMLYRPENDISQPPNILNIFNLTNNQNQPGAGPPTQSPGIFGGLFAAPSRPPGATYPAPTTTTTTTTTTTPQPSILDGLNNIFRPTSRPLVIESPDNKPIVIERPIYVAEQPVIPGIFDIFQSPNRPVHVDSNQEPWVIKDPVYVLQKPNQAPQIFGIGLPNLNIFGASSTTPSTTTSTTSSPFDGSAYPHQPFYPNPPRAISDLLSGDSEAVLEAEESLDSEAPEKPKSTAYEAAVGSYVAPVQTSTPSPSYAEINSEESHVKPDTILDQNDLQIGGLTEVISAEETVATSGTSGQEYVVEDVSETYELTENQGQLGYKKIEKQQVENEA